MNYLVIGGASGIGSQIIEKLLSENHNVYSTYNNQEITITHPNLIVKQFNVLNNFEINFLPEELNGVVYCPGKIDLKPFHRLKEESILDDFQVQVMGAVKVLQACYSLIRKSKNCSVVLFSSVALKIGFNFHTQVSISKGAIEGLTKSLAAEWAPHTRVNAIAPSITQTPLSSSFLNTEAKIKENEERHPLKSIGKAEDVASLAVFLLSENANWITGQTIVMDGGISSIYK